MIVASDRVQVTRNPQTQKPARKRACGPRESPSKKVVGSAFFDLIRLTLQAISENASGLAFARRLANVETIPQQDSAERALNKLARTFTTQIEALKRYRSTGQQKVTVEHVTVQAGGQAILGNVSHGTPANDPGQPTVPLPAIAAPDEAPLTSPGGGGVLAEKVRATS